MTELTRLDIRSIAATMFLLLILPLPAAWSQATNQGSVTTGFAEVNGKLYYEMKGQGHPIVLIHGGGLDSRMWDDQFDVFAKHYEVIRYDLRGAGKSELPKTRFSDIEDLRGLLKFLHIDKTYVIGLSRGGSVATGFTLSYPEIVDALTLVSANLGETTQANSKTMLTSYSVARDEGLSPGVQVQMDYLYFAPGKESMAAREKFQQIITDNLVPNLFFLFSTKLVNKPEIPINQRLSEIRVPTLVISGDRDDPESTYDKTAAAIPGAKRVVITGSAHMVNMVQPEQFNRTVLDFLRNIVKK